ncbi:hypothetical protein TPHA_0G02890 [Tetrapisispora phaffii CBS 4417]|uniref:Stationary phase protein 4 n=1 Tax=Tetrapisispora phaffii (strain ATCC 24235 / CBS 4417 / NBRC 1672 / NRRL Y-8282 / UCD 70-5) TaxID=1071381 RepID=G8BW52_TETPH|nr:hypothetical protein TPHA_0G02890 [Tetrapisispora phaffii CBS 4417]CCE64130.1 hypothetical protein TPHA_0G02890 [Tetrapisispora phaffii CBS 4417]
MSSIWNAFDVYDKKKHSKNYGVYGGNFANVGGRKTEFLYSSEHHEQKKPQDQDPMVAERRGSESESLNSSEGAAKTPNMLDISNMSQNEFKKLYDAMKKGEPDNRVNR